MDYNELINIPQEEQAKRYREMVISTFSHIDGQDLLARMHPRRMLDIKRRVDGVETWFEGDWLTTLMQARNGKEVMKSYHFRTKGSGQ